jgi:hypothetical protein
MPLKILRATKTHPPNIFIRTVVFIFFILIFYPLASRSQYFSIGTDPASVKWKKIKTDNFTVIFPESFSTHSQYIANSFEHVREPGSRSLKVSPPHYPVILHNRSVISNAFVPYAPKRIEFLTVPPQDNYSQDWIDGLILHEFRHTAQYAAVNTGFTRAMSVIFGQQAPPAILGVFVPFWFIEGDAVINETAMGPSGRGRVPSFEMKLRAQFLEKGIYHYDKATHGSYRDFTPDRYELGYQLVGRTRVEFGREVWANALKKTGQLPFMVVPFSHSLKKQTGLGKVKLYRHITSNMKEEWSYQENHYGFANYDVLSPSSRHYTSYLLPVIMEDGSIIAIKRSIDDIDRVVHLSEGKEKKLFTPGTGFMRDALSASDILVCWGEVMPDPRWSLRDYAVIKTYNLETGKTRQITQKSRYFAPAISQQGDRIAAVEVLLDNTCKLVVLDVKDGTILDSLQTKENLFLMHPSWSVDGTQVACVAQGDAGKTLIIWEPYSNSYEIILPFTHTEISLPKFYGDTIFYTGAYKGKDDIFSLSLSDSIVYRVSSSRFGATAAEPDVFNNSLVFSNYTADGYNISRMKLDRSSWQPVDVSKEPDYPLAEALAEQENFIYDPDSVPEISYTVKKYRKGLNLFNFHSWAPLSFDADNLDVRPGIMLLSQNLLGTSFASLSWEYDLNEEAGKYVLTYSYEGLYPALNLGLDYGLRRGLHRNNQDSIIRYKYHELNAYGGTSVPLSWSVKSWFMGARPGVAYSYIQRFMDPASGLEFKKDRINALSYRLFFYAQQKTSYRDLQPRWGQLFEVNFRHTLFDSIKTSNSIFSAAAVFYFPGLLKHHGIRLYAGFQNRIEDYYRFSNLIVTPRGQTGIFANRMSSLQAAYVFPIFYPDWRIGPVAYLKRLKSGIFYDHTFLMDKTPYSSINTVGLDLTIDLHLLSILAPFEVGLRTIYFPDDGSFGFQFLWGINIDSLY